ncbi:hypothetical protein BpHYR1_010976 [Brachionus plicatilis]|uniref:Uncharacterized protein n=1 Tax=Brachionus plicatilis TaxID=10195 RepID=A0A3M7T1I5_BRAPC|nr:hypothetical protein BpHYR1_010976 [Brachionus plicatilis]
MFYLFEDTKLNELCSNNCTMKLLVYSVTSLSALQRLNLDGTKFITADKFCRTISRPIIKKFLFLFYLRQASLQRRSTRRSPMKELTGRIMFLKNSSLQSVNSQLVLEKISSSFKLIDK